MAYPAVIVREATWADTAPFLCFSEKRSANLGRSILILRTLAAGQMHGYGIAQRLRQVSDDVLQVGEGSLYPALQRLRLNGWIKANWGASENNRRALLCVDRLRAEATRVGAS